jgi:hypothetical protein
MNTLEIGLCCSLTDPELQQRKTTILASLKAEIIEKQEIQDGFVYTFPGNDDMLNQLIASIQSERICCPFFKFELTIQDIKNTVWLKITGPDGAKEFIVHELDL